MVIFVFKIVKKLSELSTIKGKCPSRSNYFLFSSPVDKMNALHKIVCLRGCIYTIEKLNKCYQCDYRFYSLIGRILFNFSPLCVFKCAKKYTQRETIPFPIKLHPVCLSYKYKYNENALRKLFNFRSVLPFQAAVTFHLIFTIESFPSLISLTHSTASTKILFFLWSLEISFLLSSEEVVWGNVSCSYDNTFFTHHQRRPYNVH